MVKEPLKGWIELIIGFLMFCLLAACIARIEYRESLFDEPQVEIKQKNLKH